ncbi:hypothetical protein [Nonomuraea glycinis]|uniref:hypothetical protein n=1 Tax=Nonomuraea glycinis TaxID=2047744 RepID=UPI0033BF5AD0
MDLDEVAGRLYALAPSEFTAARTSEAAAAKRAGDAALARRIAGLRRPTVSAWAVNRVAREHPDELDELLSLGQELRAAWQAQDAAALAELTRRRGEVTGRLARLIRQSGEVSAAAAAEVDQTLDAAVVDAAAAEEVRRGRLVKPLSYSGFAPAPAAGRRPAGRKKSTAVDEEARAGKRAEAEAERARERQEAEVRERQEAEAAHREWSEALAGAEREHGERAEKVAKLEAKLAKARKRLAESAQRLEVTRREERHARQRLEE